MSTKWLTSDEQTVWRNYLTATRKIEEGLDAQLQRDAGIPLAYYDILVSLSEAEGRVLRMVELSRATLCSPSRLSHSVKRLEERGWVRREACEDDKRGQNARLTDEGYQALKDAAPKHVAQVREVLVDALSESQFRQLGEICSRLTRK